MEIELKYNIHDKDVADKLLQDAELVAMEETASRESLYMKAAYFDTKDYILSKNDIAFRVRTEGSKVVASLKWSGKCEGALHTREEINVPMDDEACLICPSPQIFKESDIGEEMIQLIGEKSIQSIMEVGFLRSRLRIDTGTSIMEISVDKGEIVTDSGIAPICEVEIELFSGDKEALEKLGGDLAEKYHLQPEKRSKYARGLALLQNKEGKA